MPTYLPYADAPTALARSGAWATALGCGQAPADVTRYWYALQERTGDPEADAGLPAGVDIALVIHGQDAALDALIRADQMSADELAALVALYPAYAVGDAYAVDDLVAYSGTLYRVVQAHTAQADWPPDTTPALYTPCAPAGVIPEWVQPLGSQDAYNTGAEVTHNSQVWRSAIDANVWEPGAVGSESLWTLVSNP